MSAILDIDLDYFRFFEHPVQRLEELLAWADRPVDAVFDEHHESFKFWMNAVSTGIIDTPDFLLHVDEHHDLLGEEPPINSGNFLYFVMRRWAKCKVLWLVDTQIDSPSQWLSEDAWLAVANRFRSGSNLHRGWRKPDIVTVATSPGFLNEALRKRLVKQIGLAPNDN